MEYITTWVTNIILFVLFAVIIDLLMPNSNLQRYTKMVISLLLIVIILNPILKLFNSDLEDILSAIQFTKLEDQKVIENSIENKKKEIQASQRAYILEEMAVQMKSMAEEELMKEQGLHIQDVQLQFEENKVQLSDLSELSEEDLREVEVIVSNLAPDNESESVSVVKKVEIDTSAPFSKGEDDVSVVQRYLAEIWQLDKEKVKVVMEGGKM